MNSDNQENNIFIAESAENTEFFPGILRALTEINGIYRQVYIPDVIQVLACVINIL